MENSKENKKLKNKSHHKVKLLSTFSSPLPGKKRCLWWDFCSYGTAFLVLVSDLALIKF